MEVGTSIVVETPKFYKKNEKKLFVLRDFYATAPNQMSIFVDDEVELLDDSDNNWWLVKDGMHSGYVPSHVLENKLERQARLNKIQNKLVSKPRDDDLISDNSSDSIPLNVEKKVSFSKEIPVHHIFTPDSEEDFNDLSDSDNNNTAPVRKSALVSGNTEDMDALIREFLGLKAAPGLEQEKKGKETWIEDKTTSKNGFFDKIFNTKQKITEPKIQSLKIYAGNFMPEKCYKTIKSLETLTLAEICRLAVKKFNLEEDGNEYELKLVHYKDQKILDKVLCYYPLGTAIEIAKLATIAEDSDSYSYETKTSLSKVKSSHLRKLKKMARSKDFKKGLYSVGNIKRNPHSDFVTNYQFILYRKIATETHFHVNVKLVWGSARKLSSEKNIGYLENLCSKTGKRFDRYVLPDGRESFGLSVPVHAEMRLDEVVKKAVSHFDLTLNVPGLLYEMYLYSQASPHSNTFASDITLAEIFKDCGYSFSFILQPAINLKL